MTTLYIKHMVCDRCKMVVQSEIEKLGLKAGKVDLGKAEVVGDLSREQYNALSSNLEQVGFEIIDNNNARTIEKIKNVIVELVHYTEGELKINQSQYIAMKMDKDYTYLSNLFSESEGVTIEKYIISQKIERVKELLEYGEYTLSEIADKVGYSNVAYLSSLFKKVTGITPSQYKENDQGTRKPLDMI